MTGELQHPGCAVHSDVGVRSSRLSIEPPSSAIRIRLEPNTSTAQHRSQGGSDRRITCGDAKKQGYFVDCLLLASLGLAAVACPIANMQATELQVLAGGGIATPLNEIAAQFENMSGRKIVIRFGTTPQLIKMVAGGYFDLGVVPVDVLADVPTRTRFVPGPMLDVARAGIGVAVRSGASKPDISTPEAMKQTLLKAQAVASIPASATGTLLAGIYQRIGIAEEMRAKTRAQPGPVEIVEAVVRGEADLAVFLTNVLTDPRLDIVGPFPAEIQREVIYQAGVAASSKQPDAAKAFIRYLVSPPAAAVIRSKGMIPG